MLLRSLWKDVQFLRNQGIMDYSLLLGIESTATDSTQVDIHESHLLDVSPHDGEEP